MAREICIRVALKNVFVRVALREISQVPWRPSANASRLLDSTRIFFKNWRYANLMDPSVALFEIIIIIICYRFPLSSIDPGCVKERVSEIGAAVAGAEQSDAEGLDHSVIWCYRRHRHLRTGQHGFPDRLTCGAKLHQATRRWHRARAPRK